MPFPGHTSVSNRILAALPVEDYYRLVDRAQQVTLETGAVLHESDEPIRNVYFILDGLASVLTKTEGSTYTEVLIGGREAMVGLPALESWSAIPTRAFIEIAGHAIKIKASIVKDEFHRASALQRLLLRYFQFIFVQVSQSAACNRLHVLEEQLARWLLMVHDRLGSNIFTLTDDSLAHMLGARRSALARASGTLQRAGLIQRRGADIQIFDPEELEKVSCECYGVVKGSWNRLLEDSPIA